MTASTFFARCRVTRLAPARDMARERSARGPSTTASTTVAPAAAPPARARGDRPTLQERAARAQLYGGRGGSVTAATTASVIALPAVDGASS